MKGKYGIGASCVNSFSEWGNRKAWTIPRVFEDKQLSFRRITLMIWSAANCNYSIQIQLVPSSFSLCVFYSSPKSVLGCQESGSDLAHINGDLLRQ